MESNLMSGLLIEYQNNKNLDNGDTGSSKKIVNDFNKDGYQYVDEAYINIGNEECQFKVTLYSKPGQPLFYELSIISNEGNRKATAEERARMEQFLQKLYGINSGEILQKISYNAFAKKFNVSINKITGNNDVNTDVSDNNKISIYNKNDYEALKIYNELLKVSDDDAMIKTLNKITSPKIMQKIEYMLNQYPNYKADNLYSSLEKFVYSKVSDSSTFNYSSPTLEIAVTNLIQNGAISGDDAIKTQARLASRLIFDGSDGFGTNEDVVDKGVYMIKSPVDTGDSKLNSANALKVLEEVNNIVKKHRTFYGYGKKFEDLEKYLSDDLTKGQIDYVNMIQKLNGLRDSEFQPSDIKNIIQKYSSDPSKAQKVAIIQDMVENLPIAIKDLYNSGIENGGVFADMADGISGIWNNSGEFQLYDPDSRTTVTVKGNAHGNKASLVKQDMVNYYNNIVRLTKSLETNNFEAEFKDIFKTNFNENNIKDFFEAKQKYIVASYGLSTIENFNIQRDALNKDDDNTAINRIIRLLDIKPQKQKEIEQRAKKEKLPLRYVYTQIFDKFIEKASEGYNKMLDGKTLEDYKNAQESARINAFGDGPCSNIIKRVEDYNVSQIKGAAACQITTEILMVFGSMALTGGMSAAAGSSFITRMFAKEGIRYGLASGSSHFVAEMGNKATTYEGNTWKHTATTLFDSVLDAVFTGTSETIVKKLFEKKFAGMILEKFGEGKFVKICTKYSTAATRNFVVEEGKSFASTGQLNNEKSGLKALFSAIVKALIPGSGKVSKYLFDKGTRKLATGVAYNEFYKDFNIEQLKEQNPEVKAVIESLTQEEFVSLVNDIIDEILIEAEIAAK